MRVTCVSDLHGRLPQISDCDALVIAGDICPDIEWRRSQNDPDLMRLEQRQWLRGDYYNWEATVPAATIHATPGNHDWIESFPEECRSQMHIDELVVLGDKKLWFTPWVSPCGNWNYQLPREGRRERFEQIPYKLDLLVMHGPAYGVGDGTYGGMLAGCKEMRDIIDSRQPRTVVFGHIHEGQRLGREFRLGGSVLYNVAYWGEKWKPLVIDI